MNILEATRKCKSVKSVICVTTDKVYDHFKKNNFKETDRLGGEDPYSLSKASAEFVIKSYRTIFKTNKRKCSLSSVRAGNVIGGGDWAEYRLVPDCIRSIKSGKMIIIRNPNFTRPWQHVLEPLKGYLVLAKKQIENPKKFSGDWNFGPEPSFKLTVLQVVNLIINFWGKGKYKIIKKRKFKEQKNLNLNIVKAKKILKWKASLNVKEGINKTTQWYYEVINKNKTPLIATNDQISEYMKKSNLR